MMSLPRAIDMRYCPPQSAEYISENHECSPVWLTSHSLMVLRFWPWAAASDLAAMSATSSSAVFATACRPSLEIRATSESMHITRLTSDSGKPKGWGLADGSCSAD